MTGEEYLSASARGSTTNYQKLGELNPYEKEQMW